MQKVAIVTGSRRGIGKGIAHELGINGYYVFVSATRPDAEDVISEFRNEGIDCEYVKCVVTVPEVRERLVEAACKKFGRIDLLVNNAGVAPKEYNDILKTTEESWDRVVHTNAKSMYFMCQIVANKMIEFIQAGNLEDYTPRIVNISSISAYATSINRGEYCVSKAAISMTTRLFAHRLADYGIPVFEIRPGFILTDMMSPGSRERFAPLIEGGIMPIKRWGYPQDVADFVLAIITGKLDYATGQVLNADGGYHLRRL